MKKHLLLFWISLLILIPKIQFAQWSTVLDDGKYYIVGIDFKDENTGFAGGFNMDGDSCVIIRTLDGGNNWEEVFGLPDNYVCPYCFTFINDTLIISGGQDGWLAKSTDGGENWEWYASLPWNNDIYDIYFFNDKIGFAGYYRTTDGGYNWENMEIGNTNDFYPVNDSSVFTAASHGLFYSNDYGANWLKVYPSPAGTFNSVCMANESVGYAIKDPDKIYKSIDGGMSWFLIDSLPFDEIKQIRFIDENTGYILVNTYSMRVMRTQDGGNTWDYVLFGNDYSKQMALADESTILVPTINGIMYKTKNGGGDPILPRYTEIDWYSKLKHNWSNSTPSLCLNSFSQPYIMNRFKDTLFVDEVPILISSNPQNNSTFILKYHNWGSLDWYTMIENSDTDIRGLSGTLDNYNNYYLIYREGDVPATDFNTNLVKYSSEGDSLWTKTFSSDSSLHNIVMKTTASDHIIISGDFSGTLGYDNNNIHSDNWGVFILELDQDGNFLNLNRIVEAFFSFDNIHIDINDEESICLSFSTPGPLSFNPVYINSDTLDPSYYYLFFLDQDLNLLWYNTNFDSSGKYISNIIFNSNLKILLRGRDIVNNNYYQVVYQYDDQGIKTDSTYIRTGPGNGVLCTSTNNRILTTGNYSDLSILENDTLYGFGRYGNSSIYTLSDDLEFVKSSHISGTGGVSSILENQHNSYLIGSIIIENIIFVNDTIIADGDDYFIAKLNSIITPVSEKDTYNKVSVYPNPSTGLFNISLPEGSPKNGYFEIFSITGQKVSESVLSERNSTINLSNFDKGIYFIQFNLEGEIYSQKIIIQ